MRYLIAILAISYQFAAANFLNAQTLIRRPFLGIKMDAVTEDVKRVMGLQEVKGVLVNTVFPASSAEKVGFQKGDVLLKINEHEINSPAEGVSYVASLTSGSTFTYELIRNLKKITGTGVFVPYPEEKYPDLDVIYTEVTTKTGTERIILTKPHKTGKLPLMVFLAGIGCYSLDSPFDTSRSELQLLSSISRTGYICARVEKPGVGDNVGKSKKCEEISFNDEADVYLQAIKKLEQREDVDSNSVYLFGHSMGGVIAPLVAKQTHVKGIIAYGTIGSNFLEYLQKTRRTIAEAYDMPPDSTDQYIKDYCECAVYYFAEHLTTAQAAEKDSNCKSYLSVFDYRSRAYNDEMYSINIPQTWSSFTGKALLIWGESDYISAKDDHEIIANTVNFYHPGHAVFITIPKASHGMQFATDFKQAHTNPGSYNPELGKKVIEWLKNT